MYTFTPAQFQYIEERYKRLEQLRRELQDFINYVMIENNIDGLHDLTPDRRGLLPVPPSTQADK